jgi:flavin-dependent thymidylate synthase
MDTIRTNQCVYFLNPQPKVMLMYATPEWVVAQATKGYTGHYSPDKLSEEELNRFWNELGATKLKGPLEMASTFWLIQDVTRAFTHQFARYRIGVSMVQESQRFSYQGANLAHIAVPSNIAKDSEATEDFIDACEMALSTYNQAITSGVAIQDARALLPTGICTRLYTTVSMNSLAHIYSQRKCCQAQADEWSQVVDQFKAELEAHTLYHYAATLIAPWEDVRCTTCGFGASFDRPCKNAKLFQRNLENLYWEEK